MKRLGLVLVIVLAIPLRPSAQTPPPRDMSAAEPPFGGPDVRVVRRGRSPRRIASTATCIATSCSTMKDCWASTLGHRKDLGAAAGPARRGSLAAGSDRRSERHARAPARTSSPCAACRRQWPAPRFRSRPPTASPAGYVLNWSFPVPWPADDAEAIMTALDSGGGGGPGDCGGPEHPPACTDCAMSRCSAGCCACRAVSGISSATRSRMAATFRTRRSASPEAPSGTRVA